MCIRDRIDGVTYEWSGDDYTGATIIFKHYCDFPTLFNLSLIHI